jgi:hypothetical protein
MMRSSNWCACSPTWDLINPPDRWRANCAHVVDLARASPARGVRSLSMTTNGVLLSRLAEPMAKAGLQRQYQHRHTQCG